MSEPVNRTILLLDIERFSPRDDVVQAVLRRTLHAVVDDTLVAAGVELTQQYREDRGDGLIVLISADVAKAAILRALLTATPDLLHGHNRIASQSAQMRLRMVLAAGEVADDPQKGTAGGLVGHDLNQAFRLLDSDALRAALTQRSTDGCVLCVSTSVYEGAVRHGHRGVRPESFQRVEMEVKDGVLTGWLHGSAEVAPPQSVGGPSGPAEPESVRTPSPAGSGATRGGAVFHFHDAPVVHGSVVGGDQHGVSGGQVTGDVILGSSDGGRGTDE